MTAYNFILTDTFGGEPNYSWVKRFQCNADSDLSALRKASEYFGLQGRLIRAFEDTWNIKKACMVLYIDDAYEV
jgi:hypothetical protein